ncbi:MAG TPA: protein kinase [Candidatus Hydrogenedentes bacterium]|nr:protein kinase [Candidatus Hydrogenedentota bacterium]HPG66703.1 protein kinase [Candidatus Hydrogenedentota bacterium]
MLVTAILFYWRNMLEYPLGWLPVPLPGWGLLVYKIAATLVVLWIAWGILKWPYHSVKQLFERDTLLDPSDYEVGHVKDASFQETLDAADHLRATIEPMIAKKQYDRVAEVFASLNQPADAAKWFLKAGDKRRAAENFAKAGQTVRAAKLLRKTGDFATAGRFFSELGKHRAAGKAFERAGDLAAAAQAYVDGGRPGRAVQAFAEYFEDPDQPLENRLRNANACYQILDSEKARKKVPENVRAGLIRAIAEVFVTAKHFDLAARLFREAGETGRAGEVYLEAGRHEEAAQCLREAGDTERAELVMGRFYEDRERWSEAGLAYARGGQTARAAECFVRANDKPRAAQCFEKAGAFYRASVAYLQSQQVENALRTLKQVPESDPEYDRSRLLIGRCYYLMGDYEMCAAALENQLSSRVAQKNVDYFKMLADVYDRLNKREDALSVLRRVKTVSLDSEDVDTRIQSIENRLSQDRVSGQKTQTAGGGSGPATPELSFVQNAVDHRFRFERELGRGGMGIVYLAHDTQLDRPVALKFLGSTVDGSEPFRERFLREAKSAAKVSHPNVVAIYDIGSDRGKVYLAMEYVDGESLHHIVQRRKRLPWRETLDIIGQAAMALDAVHRVGIIHRDIKPGNILVTQDGLVKLTDFGLAKDENSNITQGDEILGTPCYMSPEQALGQPLDPRTDIYSLGLVMHEALTGKTYFAKGDIIKRQQEEMPPPPSAYAKSIPKKLDAIVLTCVAKDPNDRFQSAEELLLALQGIE